MKRLVLFIIALSVTTPIFSQSITISENGIVTCKDVPIGTTETIHGDTYEVVDRDLLIQRRNEDADLTKACVSNVTDMSQMFAGEWSNHNALNQPIGNWDVSNVTDMSGMFFMSQFNQPLENWDVSNVTNMSEMFFMSQFNQPIESWNVSNVTDMSSLFQFAQYNQPLGNWDVGSVIDMTRMFLRSQFNHPIESWDVSNVTNMNSTFWDSQFNHPIGNWDVSNVTDMNGMFYNTPFNQPINKWCVTNLMYHPWGFSHQAPLTEENKPVWGTCPGGVSIDPIEQPHQFSLDQNYPNPFNPSTQIRFSLAEPSHVRLEVFSITGQSVAVLLNENLSMGSHTATFNGRNLSSGIYIYRIVTPEFTDSRLMNLIK